jgi:hypothetical protein
MIKSMSARSRLPFRYDPTNYYHLHWSINAYAHLDEQNRQPWECIKLTYDWMYSRPVALRVRWMLYSRMSDAGIVFA